MPNPNEREKDISNLGDHSDSSPIDRDDQVAESSSDPGVSRGLGLTDRLTEVLVEESDGDLLLQLNGREDKVLQWIRALDMQVIGACRVDERLKPLLKMNMSNNGAASEDRILAHLSQHFEPAEVGILARCFCMPLVSVRVGKVNKQGNLLCPLSIRGNLNLTLLPTSDMRLSFVGDDGQAETLVTLSSKSPFSSVQIGEISEDNSGRTFLVKISDGKIYFWCSEKSKLLGMELLRKMRDLLERRPSIAELTGIDASRLDCFATHLRAYLVGSAIGNSHDSASGLVASQECLSHVSASIENGQSSVSSKPLRARYGSTLAPKANSICQGSLSPRLIPFKEGLPRSISSRTARDKIKKRGENHLLAADKLSAVLSASDAVQFSSGDNQESSEANKSSTLNSLSILEDFEKVTFPASVIPISQAPSIIQPIFSPYYCWCPPGVPSLLPHSAASPPDPPAPVNDFPLPSLSSLLPNATSSLLMPTPSLSLADLPTMDFPALLPDTLSQLPKHSSPQIPTFTPLICDPIVHIPVIDVYSAGQGYLVSAGPAVTTTIPPLHPKLVNPLMPENDSMVKESARETLRLLISGSSPASAQLASVLPAVLANPDQKQGSGRRGIYCASGDVDAIAKTTTSMGLASLFGTAMLDNNSSAKNLDSQTQDSSILNDGSCSGEDDSHGVDENDERN